MGDLRLAAKKGDRAALTLALARCARWRLAKYWRSISPSENPLARSRRHAADQAGERIAHQKGWKLPKAAPPPEKPRKPMSKPPGPARARAATRRPRSRSRSFE